LIASDVLNSTVSIFFIIIGIKFSDIKKTSAHHPIILALTISSNFNRISRHVGSILSWYWCTHYASREFAIENIISGYEEPSRPVSLSIASALSAEPIEEILFFGILFCTPGNPLV
jgi:hypothetical protein